MALSRKLLKGMGLTEEQVDTIIEAHSETVNGLKEQIDELKDGADDVAELKKELKAAKEKLAQSSTTEGEYKTKYEAEHAELEKLRTEQSEKAIREKREAAAKEYFTSKGISANNLNLALRSSATEIAALEIGDDGKAKNLNSLDGLLAGDLKGLIASSSTSGVQTPNPPGTSGGKLTKAEIYAKDEKGRYKLSTQERQKALAEQSEADS